jgi:hypothetical protein
MKNSKWFERFKKACYFFSLVSWISFFMLLSFRSGVNFSKEEEYKNIQEVIKKTKEILKEKDEQLKSIGIICQQNETFSDDTIKELEQNILTLYILLVILKEAEEERSKNLYCLPKEFL